jgi:hypothetical protein
MAISTPHTTDNERGCLKCTQMWPNPDNFSIVSLFWDLYASTFITMLQSVVNLMISGAF